MVFCRVVMVFLEGVLGDRVRFIAYTQDRENQKLNML